MSTSMRIQLAGLALTSVALMTQAQAAPITWIGGNADWGDNVNNGNWNPGDEPDADDEAIFNTPNSVNLSTGNSIQALTMSAGIDLDLNGQDLTVNGLVQLVDSNTNLFVGGSGSLLAADSITVNSGADV
jgi:hypothetical protein